MLRLSQTQPSNSVELLLRSPGGLRGKLQGELLALRCRVSRVAILEAKDRDRNASDPALPRCPGQSLRELHKQDVVILTPTASQTQMERCHA